MAGLAGHWGLGVVDNPLVESVFVASDDLGFNIPPPPTMFMITETGIFMLDENGIDLMITE